MKNRYDRLKKLKIINFKEWIVIFWKSDKILKKNKLRREK